MTFQVFLYEKSASAPHRENLAAIRKGEFEGMKEKIHQPEWHPDFGPEERHPTAGTVAIGARMPLVAYNINLNTPSLEIAHDIAKKIRFIGGGAALLQSHGCGTEGARYHPGVHEPDRLQQDCPLSGF